MNNKIVNYKVGQNILIINRELPITMEGIAKKLLLLYTGPYIITKKNLNNTYEIKYPNNNIIKGMYNQASMRRYHIIKSHKIYKLLFLQETDSIIKSNHFFGGERILYII